MPYIRTYDDSVRTAVLDAIQRIVVAECQASNSPKEPEFKLYDRFPLTVDDDDVTDRVSDAFAEYFVERFEPMAAQSASEASMRRLAGMWSSAAWPGHADPILDNVGAELECAAGST